MIRVSLDSLIVIYLAMLLGVLFCVWVVGEFFNTRRARRRRRGFVICGICDHIYEERSDREIVSCPRCGALNERGKVREI